LKRDAIPSIFPWVSTSNSNERAKRQVKRNEAKERLDSDSSSESSSDNMPLSLPFDDDNVGNEIIYTAEPCEDVEMKECKVNVLSLASLRLACRLTLSFELEVLTQGKILGITSLFNLLTSATVPVKAKNCNF
jgi:hypothetical protein